MDDKYYIGLMSGTSMDGVDVVIATFSPMPKIWYQMTHPFPPELKERILNVIQGEKIDIRQVGDLDAKLGELFADSVLATLNESKIKAEEIKAIGSHGHTFWHEPFGDPAFSMQLGDPTRIAVATGIDTIADFRRKDIALGGQGAPLVPAFHAAVFSSPQLRVILNIGGISNITVLRGHQKPLGYDTGPGNVLLDIWTKKNLNKNYGNIINNNDNEKINNINNINNNINNKENEKKDNLNEESNDIADRLSRIQALISQVSGK